MRPLSINRQSSARPITSRKKGLSRWSRRRRTTLTDPNTIDGPGALILVASCEPILSAVGLPVTVVWVDFSTMKLDRKSPGEIAGVRISAAESTASQMHSTPARAESRDATERSRAGSRSMDGRCRPAQADGGRSDGARPSLRAGAAANRPTRRRRGAGGWRAPRRGLAVGHSGKPMRLVAAVPCAADCCLCGHGVVRRASLTPVQT